MVLIYDLKGNSIFHELQVASSGEASDGSLLYARRIPLKLTCYQACSRATGCPKYKGALYRGEKRESK